MNRTLRAATKPDYGMARPWQHLRRFLLYVLMITRFTYHARLAAKAWSLMV
ncbi:hypothetical protein [Hyperthermus butylicus]|uniref:hypothetical protein n=1 Tax=Hyperthermus butylicus TaxID=54248 RepID=UPI00129A9033|nr:hypothetical protein [Hyperthermus butylicus]